MKKWQKITLIPVGIVVILIVGLLLFVMFGLSTAATTAVETILPKITGTPVKLESFTVSPFTGRGTIRGFIIGNPEGFKTDSSFELGTVRVDIDLRSLFTDTIVIEEIYIDAPKITFEAGFPSNIGQIQRNVEEYAAPPEEGEEPEEPEEEEEDAKPGKKIVVRHFLLENGEIALSAKFLQGHAAPVPLPRIELHDIGGGDDGEGQSVAEVSKEIFTAVGGKVTEVATAALNKLKELGGEAVDAAGEAGRGVLDAAGEAGRGLLDTGRGILGGGDEDE